MFLRFFLFLQLLAFSSHAQVDSTFIEIHYSDEDLRIINELNGVHFVKLICTDTNMHGSVFRISADEYTKGVKKKGNLWPKCGIQKIYMSKDSLYYQPMDFCSRATFNSPDSSYKIVIAGKAEQDSVQLYVQNYGIIVQQMILGGDYFDLRALDCSTDNKIKIHKGELTPVLAYTPFSNKAGSVGSFCILGLQNVDKWYEAFDIEHYYVFNLLIE